MKFSIVTRNHPVRTGICDYLTLLRSLVESAGHEVEYDSQDPSAVCIFIEFFSTRSADTMRTLKERPILVSTEFVTGDTFDDFPGNAGHYGNARYWKGRHDSFVACARYARAIWCSADDSEQVDLYAKATGIPVYRLPFPFFPKCREVVHDKPKDIDVLFWGNGTDHRSEVLNRLAKKYAVSCGRYLSEAQRKAETARAKITVNIRQSASWLFPSHLRYWYCLNNFALILGEKCARGCSLDPYVETTEHLEERVAEVLESGEWARAGIEAGERFAAGYPARPSAEKLLDLTFSGGSNAV